MSVVGHPIRVNCDLLMMKPVSSGPDQVLKFLSLRPFRRSASCTLRISMRRLWNSLTTNLGFDSPSKSWYSADGILSLYKPDTANQRDDLEGDRQVHTHEGLTLVYRHDECRCSLEHGDVNAVLGKVDRNLSHQFRAHSLLYDTHIMARGASTDYESSLALPVCTGSVLTGMNGDTIPFCLTRVRGRHLGLTTS